MTFEQIKKNFERRLWNKQMVAKAVEKGVITAEQYEKIIGETVYKNIADDENYLKRK